MHVISLLTLLGTVQVTGKTECPQPAEVSQALDNILAEDGTTRSDEARLSVVGNRLSVELINSDSLIEARRTLDLQGSCEEIAQKVALVIALWEANLQVNPLTPPAAPTPPPIALAAQSSRPAQTPSSRGWLLSPSLGLLASFMSGAGVSAAAELRLVTGPKAANYRGFVSMTGVSAHEARFDGLNGASTQWSRVSVAAGPGYNLGFSSFSLASDVGLALGRTWVRGRGFDSDREPAAWDPSAIASVRLILKANSSAPWVGLVAAYGLSQKRLVVEGTVLERGIPRTQVLLGAGFGLELFL